MSGKPHTVLYAEDSEDDAFLMRRAFSRAKFPGTLVVVPNGLEALNYLVGEKPYDDRKAYPLPSLILVDIKMPHLSGLELLRWIRARDIFARIPIIMLTSSSQPSDVTTAYGNGADCYLVKPSNLDVFSQLVADLMPVCEQGRPPPGKLQVTGCIPHPAA